MSAFDDEFGLFGDEQGEEEERRSTLGARTIASGETVIDDIEPEDERPRRARPRGSVPEQRAPESAGGAGAPPWAPRRPPAPEKRPPLAADVAHPRAVELLRFLAKRLVSKPDAVRVELRPDARGAVLELEVAPDDLGKVIGRGGRVAQALRTVVRAGAEGRVTIDILDSDDEDDGGDGGGASPVAEQPRAAPTPRAEPTPGADAPLAGDAPSAQRSASTSAAPSAADDSLAAQAPAPKRRPARKRAPAAVPVAETDAAESE